MSLMRTALRLTAVQALRQRTWAESRVYDSDNTPLAQAVTGTDEKLPYIVVYTDTDNRTGPFAGREVHDANRETSLVLEIAVASAVEADGGGIAIRTPATDQGMEIALDFTEAQAIRALLGDPQSPWCELFHDIVIRVIRMPSVRAGDSSKGVKWAARQTVIVCDIISDPPAGVTYEELGNWREDEDLSPHPILRFIELARTVGNEFAQAADLIDTMIKTQASYPDWQKAQAWLGITREAIRAGGTAPLPDAAAGPFTVPVSITDPTTGEEPGPIEEIFLPDAGDEPPFHEDFTTERE